MQNITSAGRKFITRKMILPLILSTHTEYLFSQFTKNNLLVLLYHGIGTSQESTYNGRHFHDKIFEKQLIYFKKNFSIVSLPEIFKIYHNKESPRTKTIAITFDDGYLNNYNIAFPLLKKYAVPATIFVTTMGVDNEKAVLWPDLINILRQHTEGGIEYKDYYFDRHLPYDFYDKHHKLSLSDYIKYLSVNEREIFLSYLTKRFAFYDLLENIDENYWKLVSREHVVKLSQSGLIEIGSHSVSHFNLANIDQKNAENEIIKSKETLENVLQKEVESFAFPDGNYDEFVKKICLDAGYKYLTAVNYHLNSDINDPDIIQRYGVGPTTDHNSKIVFIHKAFNQLGF